jgi:hypothetical protein
MNTTTPVRLPLKPFVNCLETLELVKPAFEAGQRLGAAMNEHKRIRLWQDWNGRKSEALRTEIPRAYGDFEAALDALDAYIDRLVSEAHEQGVCDAR